MKPRLTEQVDHGEADNPVYSWLLDCLPMYLRPEVPAGWEWIRGAGCPGAYRTFDQSLARSTAAQFGIETVDTNSTHRLHDSPILLTLKL